MRVSHLRPGRALSLSGLRWAGLALALAPLLAAPALVSGQAPAPTQAPAPKPTQAPAPKPSAPSVKAPDVAAKLPSARSIIDRHIAAIGGRKAILSHSSSHATGTMAVPRRGMTGTLDIYGAKPDKSLVRINSAASARCWKDSTGRSAGACLR